MARPQSRYDPDAGEGGRSNNRWDRFQNSDNVNVNLYNNTDGDDSDDDGDGIDEEKYISKPISSHTMVKDNWSKVGQGQPPVTRVAIDTMSTSVSEVVVQSSIDKSPLPQQQQQSSFSTTWTVTKTYQAPDVLYTMTATPVFTGKAVPTVYNGDIEASFDLKDAESKKVILYAAAGVVPVIVMSILGVFLFFYLRKRKRQREIVTTQQKLDEMKSRGQPLTTAPYDIPPPSRPSSSSPEYSVTPPAIQAHYLPPGNLPPMAGPTTLQPVILGPIAPNSNGAYFTGIDTSDVVSVNDRTGLGDPFADSNSLSEEPPPPYRPRSLPPISRDSSLRMPAAYHSRTNLISQELSPFADPRDDDAVSVISGTALNRQNDAMSAVSDLSYQEDPIVSRRAV